MRSGPHWRILGVDRRSLCRSQVCWVACFVFIIITSSCVTCVSCDSIIGSPSNPRREDPENFLVIFGAFNISDVTDEQVIGIDMIIKVRNTQEVSHTFKYNSATPNILSLSSARPMGGRSLQRLPKRHRTAASDVTSRLQRRACGSCVHSSRKRLQLHR